MDIFDNKSTIESNMPLFFHFQYLRMRLYMYIYMKHVQYHWHQGNKLLLKNIRLQHHDIMITTHWKVLHLARQTN